MNGQLIVEGHSTIGTDRRGALGQHREANLGYLHGESSRTIGQGADFSGFASFEPNLTRFGLPES